MGPVAALTTGLSITSLHVTFLRGLCSFLGCLPVSLDQRSKAPEPPRKMCGADTITWFRVTGSNPSSPIDTGLDLQREAKALGAVGSCLESQETGGTCHVTACGYSPCLAGPNRTGWIPATSWAPVVCCPYSGQKDLYSTHVDHAGGPWSACGVVPVAYGPVVTCCPHHTPLSSSPLPPHSSPAHRLLVIP